MENINKIILSVLVSVIVVAFFLPWVQIESQHVGAVSKILTGKKQASMGTISGFQVPIHANRSDSKLAMSVIKIFAPNVEHADKKSFLVYIFPILSILIFFAVYYYGNNEWVHIGIAAMCIAIFAVGVLQIVTMDLDKVLLNIRIGIGLWLILIGYLGIGLVEVANYLKMKGFKIKQIFPYIERSQ
jgi:hypothetical protein